MAAEQHTPDRYAFTDLAGESWLVLTPEGPRFGAFAADRLEVVGEHNARDLVTWQRSKGCHLEAVNVSRIDRAKSLVASGLLVTDEALRGAADRIVDLARLCGPPCERISRRELAERAGWDMDPDGGVL